MMCVSQNYEREVRCFAPSLVNFGKKDAGSMMCVSQNYEWEVRCFAPSLVNFVKKGLQEV